VPITEVSILDVWPDGDTITVAQTEAAKRARLVHEKLIKESADASRLMLAATAAYEQKKWQLAKDFLATGAADVLVPEFPRSPRAG
jgi:hypothetical protein